jgi:membrane associated rhomboid family serine protease
MNIYHIIIIFSITALLGVTLLTFVLNNKPRPMPLIAAKGIFALVSICTLYFYVSDETMDMKHAPMASVIFLSFATLGGVYLFFKDKVLGQENYPKWMVFGHAAAAVIGYVLLWIHALSRFA